MKIDDQMIKHLQELARMELSKDEEAQLAEQLTRIVAYVKQLQAVDTSGIAPTSAVVHEARETLRADETRPGLDREVILEEAPDSAEGFFRVPKVVERQQP